MKKITFFRNLIVLVALLIGSGSAMGGTHITEGFSTTSLPGGWSGDVYFNSTANIGNLSGANGAGFNANNKYLQLPSVNSAGTLTFWMKGSAAASAISLKVEMSVGGGSFTTIAEFPKPHTTTAVQKTVDINNSSNNIVLKFVAYDRTGNSIYLDDVVLTDYIACTASNLAFGSPTTVEKLAGDNNFTKTATSLNETTAIVYSSSDTDVATVNSSTGEVDILAAGTTIITATQAAGTHNSVDYCAGEVTYTLNVAPVDPTITVTEETVPAMSAYVDASDSETITVNGVNLTENITLTLGGDNASQFRLSTSTLTQTDGSVTDASVTIYYEPKAIGSHTATVTLSSTGAENVVKTLSGEATWTPLTTPVAEAASGTNNNGFTANWVEVAGATEYQLNVYTKETATETFDTAPTAPTGWTFSGVGSYTASSTGYFGTTAPSVKFDGSADNIVSTTYVNSPNRVSFWLRGASTDANSALLFEGYNGTEWITIENIQPVPTVATTKVYDGDSSPSLSGNFNQYRFTYTKSAGNLAYDDFSAIRVDSIVGSPFTIVGETTKVLSGLNSGTTYYYTVIAKNSNVTSDVSNEITAPTMSTSNNDLLYGLNIRVTNANIHFAATAGEKVEVYNAVGQKIISTLATDGQNELPVNAKGVMIVKVGSRLAKVIL
jgi:hypothetical protein